MRSLAWSLVALAIAACGDNSSSTPGDPDAPGQPTVDAPRTIDATVCTPPADYPENVRLLRLNLEAPRTLTLPATGDRCERLVAALTDPTNRPPELADLDATGTIRTNCSYDDVLDRDIVRVFFEEYAGVRVYAPVQNILAHVTQANELVFLAGEIIPAGQAPPAACLTPEAVLAAVPGAQLGYTQFAACTPTDFGMYTVAADDTIELAAEGVYLGEDGLFRRVRAVDVFLLEAHVTDTYINSDLFCCDPGTLVHCVGKRLFVDVLTGAIVGETGHCLTC